MCIKSVAKNGQQYQKWLFAVSKILSKIAVVFSFSTSFKNSNPREKVAKLSSFWDWWAEPLFVSIIAAKYNIFPHANNGRSREKQNISGEAICWRYQRALSGFWARLRILNVIGPARALCYNKTYSQIRGLNSCDKCHSEKLTVNRQMT